MQISWQAPRFVNLHVQISWQAQRFVNLEVQISWQAQHFVNLHVQVRPGDLVKGSLVCKTSVLRTFHSCSTTTHHTPLIKHHSSCTTHHTPLIIHHFSYTTHHTPLIIHHSSYTTHHTPLVIHHSSYTTHHTCADFVAGAALCAPPCADFVAGAIQNALWRDSERTKCCIFQWNRWLRSWQVKVCGTTVARRSRVVLGSFSGMVGIVPPLGLEFSLVS